MNSAEELVVGKFFIGWLSIRFFLNQVMFFN
jgi:hypothetical protein